MSDQDQRWSLIRAMRDGIRELFPTRRTRAAMWGIVALGLLVTYLELLAAQFFSSLITNIDEQSSTRTIVVLVAFLLTFAGIKSAGYFQSVYRLTIFDRSLRHISTGSGPAESWRWPMAIELVSIVGQFGRLALVTIIVATVAPEYGGLLLVCSLVAFVIADRTGRTQYEVHRGFVEAKSMGAAPTAAERVGARVRSGERAGLAAVVPILVFVAALGLGAADGRVSAQSALVLFISARMTANMYGSLAMSTMRYIRAEVAVESYERTHPAAPESADAERDGPDDAALRGVLEAGGYLHEPPSQSFARLVDDGTFVGDATAIGRAAREARFGPNPWPARQAPAPTLPSRSVADGPDQAWCHATYAMPVADAASPVYLNVLLDAYSRLIVRWSIDDRADDVDVERLFRAACADRDVAPEDVALFSSRILLGRVPNLHDWLRGLKVVRTLTWSGRGDGHVAQPGARPEFPGTFDDAARCADWVARFVGWYNDAFYQPDIGYLHPSDVHAGLADVVTARREATVDEAATVDGGPAWGEFPDEWLPPREVRIEELALTTTRRERRVVAAIELDEDDET